MPGRVCGYSEAPRHVSESDWHQSQQDDQSEVGQFPLMEDDIAVDHSIIASPYAFEDASPYSDQASGQILPREMEMQWLVSHEAPYRQTFPQEPGVNPLYANSGDQMKPQVVGAIVPDPLKHGMSATVSALSTPSIDSLSPQLTPLGETPYSINQIWAQPAHSIDALSTSGPLAMALGGGSASIDDTSDQFSGLTRTRRFWASSVPTAHTLSWLASEIEETGQEQGNHDSLRPLMLEIQRMDAQARLEITERPVTLSNRSGEGLTDIERLLPPAATCDALVDHYVNTFETVFRILHVPSFLREYAQFRDRRLRHAQAQSGSIFPHQLLLVLAISVLTAENRNHSASKDSTAGSGQARHATTSLQNQAAGWILHARESLEGRLRSSNRSSISIAQCLCLLALVRHVYDDEVGSAGAMIHINLDDCDLARRGMQFGFHRDPLVTNPDMPVKEVEIRRRLWATMLELSLQRCLDDGMAPPLAPESYDCRMPENVTDAELDDESGLSRHSYAGSADTAAPLDRFTPCTMLIMLARTQALRIRCLHLLHSPGLPRGYEGVYDLATKLDSLCAANLSNLRALAKPISDFQLTLMQICTSQVTTALHTPFIRRTIGQPFLFYSRKARMEAAVRTLGHPNGVDPKQVMKSTGKKTADANRASRKDPEHVTASGYQQGGREPSALHVQGHLGRAQRQAAVFLCIDLVDELEENPYRSSEVAGWFYMLDVIKNVSLAYEQRVQPWRDVNVCREYIFMASAEAYIDAMLRNPGKGTKSELPKRAEEALAVCRRARAQMQGG